jgi:Helix-turn-helix domain
MKTLDIDQCAEFLKINITAATEMAAVGELPGARIGRAWVFLEEDLVEYVRTQVRYQRRERQAVVLEKAQDEGRDADQDVLATLPTILQNRRSRRGVAPERSRDFAAEDAPASSGPGG